MAEHRPWGHPVAERWVAGYVRVSTDAQVERDSLTTQEQALTAHCQAQGWTLQLYRDEGVSAKDTERPALQRLLADVRSGRVAAVLVTKLDRISRSLRDLLDLVALFEAAGVKFVSLRDNIDTSGPVGRFILHILGAIAELERGITAERVAEDMKLRAKRGKWNGGMAPYGRRLVDGRLVIVPEEAEVLQRMRLLLKEKRSWRGVTIALNHEGRHTRGWEPAEKNGRTARKGKPPSEWTPTTVKRVLLQRINEGTLVYNRRQAKGRTHAPRPEEEHVVVENYCEPIFSREEMAEVLRIAAEIEGEPPRRTGSEHLLSGLVYCHCGSRMQAAKNYVTTARGRYPLVYYRCRRATHNGTCTMRQVPAAALEPMVVRELRTLGLDPERLRALAGAAKARFRQEAQPLFERREALMRGIDRLESRTQALLELAEDRLITKAEFVERKERLQGERQAWEDELAGVAAELEARAATAADIEGALASLRRLSDVYDELEEVSERRRLLEICLGRLVVRPEAVELHVPAYPTLVVRLDDTEQEMGAAGSARHDRQPVTCSASPQVRPKRR